MKNLLIGKKTYLIALVSIVYGIVAYGVQDHNWYGAAKFILAGSGAASLRAAIAGVEARILAALPKPVEEVVKPLVDAELAKVEG